MPSAVRKSAARSSPEHVSFLSPIPTHLNTSTPSTLVLNAMAVWRPAMRSSFAVAGSGDQVEGGDTGGPLEPVCNRRAAAAVSAASTGIGRVWGGAVNWATVALSSLLQFQLVVALATRGTATLELFTHRADLGVLSIILLLGCFHSLRQRLDVRCAHQLDHLATSRQLDVRVVHLGLADIGESRDRLVLLVLQLSHLLLMPGHLLAHQLRLLLLLDHHGLYHRRDGALVAVPARPHDGREQQQQQQHRPRSEQSDMGRSLHDGAATKRAYRTKGK
eukprot:scaffold71010_cov54-Phaeocystis_antarctica.AAC.1